MLEFGYFDTIVCSIGTGAAASLEHGEPDRAILLARGYASPSSTHTLCFCYLRSFNTPIRVAPIIILETHVLCSCVADAQN